MKKLIFLFLFFFLYGALFTCLYAQKKTDSLKYYYDIILKPKRSTKIGEAFVFYNTRIYKNLKKGDTIAAIQDLRLIAIGQFELGLLNESELSAIRALKLLDKLPLDSITTEAKYAIFNHLGLVYKQLKLADNALNYYNKALQLATKTNDSIQIINNIANVYSYQKEYNRAVEKLSFALKQCKSGVDNLNKALILDNLGFNQGKINHPKALKNLFEGLELRTEEQDLIGMYSSHRFLSMYYLDREQNDNALTHANEAYRIANIISSAPYIENALSLLLDIDNDPKVILYKKLRDSMSLAKQQQENKYAFIKYNVEKEKEKTHEAELEKQTQQNVYLIIILIIFMGTGFIIYYKNQQRKRTKELATYETETRLSKKVHDEFANDISGIITLIDNIFNVPIDEKNKLLEYLNDLYLRSRDLSTQIAGIDIRNYSDSLKNLIAQHNTSKTTVIINSITAFPWHKITEHTKIAIYRSLQELLINTKKHAKATQITIAIKKYNNKNRLIYTDNGIGFTMREKKLNGLCNVETRMHDIGGKITFESQEGKGFKAHLIF